MSAAGPAVAIDSVGFSYPSRSGPVPVLHRISLSVGRDEWVAIMGPSGSGKSTLLLCAAGLLRAETGSAVVDGVDVVHAREQRLTRLRRDRLGFVFQDFNLVPALNAVQNVGLPARFGGRRPRAADLAEALDRVGLRDKAAAHPDELSGGQRQRVAIARALVTEPAVVFADEPTGSLDARSGDLVLREFQALAAAGAAVLMVTHDPRVAARADRTVFMSDGRLVDELPHASAQRIASRLAGLEEDVA